MNAELLDQFLSEDGDAHVRRKLLDAISGHRTTGSLLKREYNFNRFDVTLDFETKQVFLSDVLTVGPKGEYKLGMYEFEKALQ